MEHLELFKKNNLSFIFIKVQLRDFIQMEYCPYDIYTYENQHFQLIMEKHSSVLKQDLTLFLMKETPLLAVKTEYINHYQSQMEELRNLSRSISIGDPSTNAKKQIDLIAINLKYLYFDPNNDELLILLHQSTKVLLQFLLENTRLLPDLYFDYNLKLYGHIISQPILSSLVLLGLLIKIKQHSLREIENIFIANMFKDIGMSVLPIEHLEKTNLSGQEKNLLSQHEKISLNILEGRLPLNEIQFEIISGHHLHSLLSGQLAKFTPKTKPILQMVAMIDTLVAMTSFRPYRDPIDLFPTLEFIRDLMGKNYYQEFKMLLQFVQSFYIQKK